MLKRTSEDEKRESLGAAGARYYTTEYVSIPMMCQKMSMHSPLAPERMEVEARQGKDKENGQTESMVSARGDEGDEWDTDRAPALIKIYDEETVRRTADVGGSAQKSSEEEQGDETENPGGGPLALLRDDIDDADG